MKLGISIMVALSLTIATLTGFIINDHIGSIVPTSPIVVVDQQQHVGPKRVALAYSLPADLSSKQKQLLVEAYNIAKADGLSDPKLLQAIILRETRAGGMQKYSVAGQELGLKTNLRYYGVSQLKLAAARDVLAKWPRLFSQFGFQTQTDEEVIAKLIADDLFNLHIASKYLLLLRNQGFRSNSELALAYNQGAGGARLQDHNDSPYARAVVQYISKLGV